MGILSKMRKKLNKKISKERQKVVNKHDPLENRMEDLIVSAKEHEILRKFSTNLQKRFNVQIKMPNTESLSSDIIFVRIEGEEPNREYVKKFLTHQMENLASTPQSGPSKEHAAVKEPAAAVKEPATAVNEPAAAVKEPAAAVKEPAAAVKESYPTKDYSPPDDDVIILSSSEDENEPEDVSVITLDSSIEQPKKRKADIMMKVSKKRKLSNSVVIMEEEPSTSNFPALDFIPLISKNNSKIQKNKYTKNSSHPKPQISNKVKKDDSVIILDDHIPNSDIKPRRLRPIVIDGSNVAREHGKSTNTFSVKGIKLALDYFLNRGHTEVTAFVPRHRRNANPKRKVVTTDAELLDELHKVQQVTFTPSRRINEKLVSSYDDRFIVQLAATNGGIIVSNDNFRDLIEEKESFKKAIEERLLMFCFVGDVFMVPEDPIGRNGPHLDDFLRFPPES